MVMLRFTPEDHAQVTAAVVEAERRSDGEIVTIVAAKSDAYHDVALHYAVLAMLAVPALIALAPRSWIDRLAALLLGWNAKFSMAAAMIGLFAALALAFLLVRLLLRSTAIRMKLTPKKTKTRRVHRRAVELFRSGCELKTRGRTGILIYLSVAEQRAEILADKTIADQVEPDIWGAAMASLLEEVRAGRPAAGMTKAVEQVGELLARILPPSSSDTNELPDRLVEL